MKDYQKNYKKDPAALVSLGNTFLSAKLYDQANAMADLALKRDKNYGDAFILKGDIEAKLPGWEVIVAPLEAVQLVKFLKDMTA